MYFVLSWTMFCYRRAQSKSHWVFTYSPLAILRRLRRGTKDRHIWPIFRSQGRTFPCSNVFCILMGMSNLLQHTSISVLQIELSCIDQAYKAGRFALPWDDIQLRIQCLNDLRLIVFCQQNISLPPSNESDTAVIIF